MPVQATNPYHPSLSQAALHSAPQTISATVLLPRGLIRAGRITQSLLLLAGKVTDEIQSKTNF